MNDTSQNSKLRNKTEIEKEHYESKIRRLVEELNERKESGKSLEDILEEQLNAHQVQKDGCKGKVMHIDFMENELANAFRKIKKLKKWIKAIENRFYAMCIKSSDSNKSDESILETNINAAKNGCFNMNY